MRVSVFLPLLGGSLGTGREQWRGWRRCSRGLRVNNVVGVAVVYIIAGGDAGGGGGSGGGEDSSRGQDYAFECKSSNQVPLLIVHDGWRGSLWMRRASWR